MKEENLDIEELFRLVGVDFTRLEPASMPGFDEDDDDAEYYTPPDHLEVIKTHVYEKIREKELERLKVLEKEIDKIKALEEIYQRLNKE